MSTATPTHTEENRSYSPSSPPLASYKQHSSSTFAHPQTPTSPQLMSLSSQNASPPSNPSHTSSGATTSQAQPASTPPSTTPMSAQNSQQTGGFGVNTMPTPASSVTGFGPATSTSNMGEDSIEATALEENISNEEVSATSQPQTATDEMDVDGADHRRTNHERQGESNDSAEPKTTSEGSSDLEGGLTKKHSEVSENRPDLSRLDADFGSLYLLSQNPYIPSQPHPGQDLLSLYSLQPLAATVSRIDPATGEKKKTRKTYKKYLQMFPLAGRNTETSHPANESGNFEELLSWPEEEWFNQKVAGKDINDGLGEGTLAKLDRAMALHPGPIPGIGDSLFSEDDATKGYRKSGEDEPTGPIVESQKGHRSTSGGTVNRQNPTNGEPGSGETLRPRRATRKRRYDDHSFEGYGEGFGDSDAEGHVRSDSEDDRRGSSGKKKRKKNSGAYSNATSPGIADRGGTYGVGMVGVGSGIGTYGR